MKNIQDCAKLYNTLLNKTYYFTIENNIEFKLFFRAENFPHLLGFHKLTDLNLLKQRSAKVLYKKILSGDIKTNTIQNSKFYNIIRERISRFESIIDMLNKDKSKIIVDYDNSLVCNSKLHNTKYILYQSFNDGYLLFTIADIGNGEYPETLFFEISKKYISGQTLLDIINININIKR